MTEHALDDLLRDMDRIARELKRRANYWVHTGRIDRDTMRSLRRSAVDHDATRTRVLFTRDEGMHTSGWIRNPDYDRCFHLSLSPYPTNVPGDPVVEDRALIERYWVHAFYGTDAPLTWRESAKSPEGKALEVAHWRLFADRTWTPIQPRGEVYSSRWTPPDWRSWTEVHAAGEGPIIESYLDPR